MGFGKNNILVYSKGYFKFDMPENFPLHVVDSAFRHK
jgi:hypothetical protein